METVNVKKIVTLDYARINGLNKYFTGKPCKYGHLSERWTKSNKCVQCKTNLDRSGRQDGKKLDPSKLNNQSIPMPALDDTKLTDLNLVNLDTTGVSNEQITKAEWLSLAQIVNKVDTFKQWLIGDLWNLCEWGNKSNMMESMGINSKSAQEYGRVASRVPHDMRRANLSFSHHQELCVQQVQDDEQLVMFLDRVETSKMSVKETRKMMVNLQKALTDGEGSPDVVVPTTKEFLKSYKKFGKQLKDLEDIPPSLQTAFDNLLFEFKKLK